MHCREENETVIFLNNPRSERVFFLFIIVFAVDREMNQTLRSINICAELVDARTKHAASDFFESFDSHLILIIL